MQGAKFGVCNVCIAFWQHPTISQLEAILNQWKMNIHEQCRIVATFRLLITIWWHKVTGCCDDGWWNTAKWMRLSIFSPEAVWWYWYDHDYIVRNAVLCLLQSCKNGCFCNIAPWDATSKFLRLIDASDFIWKTKNFSWKVRHPCELQDHDYGTLSLSSGRSRELPKNS